jgi:CCR4-NOT transcription complex subunit 7/8
VRRATDRCHQVASDSVLTWDTFRQMKRLYFAKEGTLQLCAGVVFGLELDDDAARQHTR